MSVRHHITEWEIQQALAEFRNRGGIVRTLPAEVGMPTRTVGVTCGAYEDLADLRSKASGIPRKNVRRHLPRTPGTTARARG